MKMRSIVGGFSLLAATAFAAVDFNMVARHYYPAGYMNGTTEGVPDLYGYGFGALERSYYDANQKIFYGGSELGFVTISDFQAYPEITITDLAIPLDDSLTDIKVCGDLLFVSTKSDPLPGMLHVFSAVVRNADDTLEAPSLIQSVVVGVGPDNILVSKDCLLVATADEGEGDYDLSLINPVGSITILRGPFDDSESPPSVSTVSLNKWTDDELLEKGVHMPLTLNSMKYWNSTGVANFNDAILNYTPDMILEPEYLAFGAGETMILANLQENNAVVVIDVETSIATDIFAYGLKSGFPVDIVSDGGCEAMPVVEGLSFLRSADSITSFEKDGQTYIITANEGDDVGYGDFEEKIKGGDLFNGTELSFAGWTVDNAILQQARYFNGECNATTDAETSWCSAGMSFSIGSSMVDFSDPLAPNIYNLVGIGGRGITIYKVTESALDLVWDSESDFEREGCSAFPWAHNGIQDEEFALSGGALFSSLALDDSLRSTIYELNDPEIDGCADRGDGLPGACPLGQTVDERSTKDGYAAETVVVGEACDSMYAVTVSEKNSVGFLYDISDVLSPSLEMVFHLSPESELLTPGLAYDARMLGEIDAESIQFIPQDESPTGKAAVLFSGAFSGTTSLWEFTCTDDASTQAATSTAGLRLFSAGAPMLLIGFLLNIQ